MPLKPFPHELLAHFNYPSCPARSFPPSSFPPPLLLPSYSNLPAISFRIPYHHLFLQQKRKYPARNDGKQVGPSIYLAIRLVSLRIHHTACRQSISISGYAVLRQYIIRPHQSYRVPLQSISCLPACCIFIYLYEPKVSLKHSLNHISKERNEKIPTRPSGQPHLHDSC